MNAQTFNPASRVSESREMNIGGDWSGLPEGLVKFISGGLVGAAGSLAMWFNDILNGDAIFSLANFFMLVFIGAIIGVLAIIIAPMFHIDEHYVIVFSCSAAASHKYIFRSASWFLDKWTSSK